MTVKLTRRHPDRYVDSVLLMAASRAMLAATGVEWAAALMSTPANVAVLAGEGFDTNELGNVRANDLLLAVQARSAEEAGEAFQVGERALHAPASVAGGRDARRPGSIEEAQAALPTSNLALISVPGPYAALEAHKALSAGLHVLLFSDNVPLEDEIALKSRGEELGLLVMGPGAGTAVLGGIGLGFANAVTPGRVGIVAAAGTGAQEVMSLLTRWGAGVSHVIGVGGRDVSQRLGGRMTRLALHTLEADSQTDVLLLVSKPPAAEVARALLQQKRAKPLIAALVGLAEPIATPDGVCLARTMEEAVLRALAALSLPAPQPGAGLAARLAARPPPLSERRRAVRGLFSGGTLCSESMAILSRHLGPVYSNTPLRDDWRLPAPPGAHLCLDLGDEEFTRGRPHPMIDPQGRAELLGREGQDPSVAVLLIDVVLGYGAHPDPASILAPACREVSTQPDAPVVVAYVLGTDGDPQGYGAQSRQLETAGCLLAPTGARAALLAAAVAARRPAIAEGTP